MYSQVASPYRPGTMGRRPAGGLCVFTPLRGVAYASTIIPSMPVPQRICSLLPSATEMLAQLGCGDLLVGRSAECQFPEWVTALPVVTAAGIDTSRMAGAAIDRAVREAVLD